MNRFALSVAAGASLLAGCGGPKGPIGIPSVKSDGETRAVARYKIVYRFKGGADGWSPYSDLVNVNGVLYGTTENGGDGGGGTVFAFDPSTGKERVVANSVGNPSAGGPLLNANKILYGAGRTGGRWGLGVVFELNLATGKTKSICSMHNQDGQYPNMGLIEFNGGLYGTTYGGGDTSQGAVFACDPSSGRSHVVYSFKGAGNGAGPVAGLTAANGELFGTTFNGGFFYYGTAFALRANGNERRLYSFDMSGGAWPAGQLRNIKGTLYGTTSLGGDYGEGSVFRISRFGAEHVVYSFKGTPDGYGPASGIVDLNGSFYGTTEYGGSNSDTCRGQCGTVYRLTSSGKELVLHRFEGKTDGSGPISGLTNVKGALYGTTSAGGGITSCVGLNGCGTIYEILP